MEDKEVIEQCNTFLQKSDRRFNVTIQRAVDDLKRYSGTFWTEDYIKDYKRQNKMNLTLNNWNPMVNAIASPISNSPWHVELTNKEQQFAQIQQLIDELESENDTKSALVDAFRKAVLTGYGYIVATTIEDEYTGLPKVYIESASHIDAIALDPTINTVDGNDAEEGAVINYISLKKARRLYGNDVAPMQYPRTECVIAFSQFKQWKVPEDSIAQISYYVKNEQGTVDYYKIVGDKVVEHVAMPIKYIPIIRICGNEIIENNQINYNGIIQQTLSLELGANMAYSSLIERSGRSAKANFMYNVDAIDGVEDSVAECNLDDTAVVLWKGEHQPVPLVEGFQTGDLTDTIQTCRTLMEDVLGVPLTGIQDERERTATEILRQETAKESNTASYYNNAFKAVRTLAKIIIQLLNNGQDLRFTLENGPYVITREMKQRQELTALSTIMPDEMKPIIAKYFADTLKNDLGEDLSKNIVANLPPNVNFVTEDQDPAAIHVMNQMKMQLDETMAELELSKQEAAELKKQLDAAQLSMMNQREQRVIDFQKFQIAERDKVMLETAKLEQNGVKIDNDAIMKQQEINIKAAESAVADAQKETDAEIREQQAYVDGAIDGSGAVLDELTGR